MADRFTSWWWCTLLPGLILVSMWMQSKPNCQCHSVYLFVYLHTLYVESSWPTWSPTRAWAADFLFLKLTNAQNLSGSDRTLVIAPYLCPDIQQLCHCRSCHIWFNFFNFGALPSFLHYITINTVRGAFSYKSVGQLLQVSLLWLEDSAKTEFHCKRDHPL